MPQNRPTLQQAFALHQQGRLAEAAAIYERLIADNPRNSDALHFLGIVRAGSGKLDEARQLIERSLAGAAKNPRYLENYATVLIQVGDAAAAVEAAEAALRIEPGNPNLNYLSAVAHYKARRLPEALAKFDAALAREPRHVIALNERASVLAEMKAFDEALTSVDRALALAPQYPQGHLNRGNICAQIGRLPDAQTAYQQALALEPRLLDAWLGLGHLLRMAGQHQPALEAYERVLAANPKHAAAWLGRGHAFFDLKRFTEAIAAYREACAVDPKLPYAAGAYVHAKLVTCDWTNLLPETDRVLAAVRAGEPACTPFDFLSFASSSADILACAKTFAPRASPPGHAAPAIRLPRERIRLAYLSSDFRDHPVAYLAAGMFERHDRSRFETTAISLSPPEDSEMQRRLRNAFDHFIDAAAYSDRDLFSAIHELRIDILVDLMGYTRNHRAGVLARRPASVQVSHLGYAATMGGDFIDYILADRTVVVADEFVHYTEKVVWLPDTFQVNDDKRDIADTTPTRAECELPEHGFVFCAFGQTHKILPDMFETWMRILHAVDGSVLWLSRANEPAMSNLRNAARQHGVPPDRLIFAPRTERLADHLARHRHGDLLLDTLPYNAHTTTSDALWTGVPVLTCIGTTFSGRVTASCLKAAGLEETITSSLADYEAVAIRLARQADELAAIKRKLSENRRRAPLFDTERFTRHLEAAYDTMWDIYSRGESPRSFAVPPLS